MSHNSFSSKLSFKDFFSVLKKGRSLIFLCALLGAFLGLFNSIGKPLQWKSEASFREEGIATEQGGDKGIFQLLTGSFSDDQGKAVTHLSSRLFLEKLVQKEDLQATLYSDSSFRKKLLNMYHNVKGVYSHLKKRPFFKEKGGVPYIVKGLKFSLYEPESAVINVRKDGYYSVKYKGKRSPYQPLGTPFANSKFSFTLLAKMQKNDHSGSYFLDLQPMHRVVKNLSSQISVEPSPLDAKLIDLSFIQSDRGRAQKVLDSMMALYREEMKRQQELIAKEQVQYLHKRLEEEQQTLEKSLEAYADQMNQVVDSIGFARTDAAYAFLAGQQGEGKKRLSSLDLEAVRLEQLKNQEALFFDKLSIEGDAALINALLSEIRQLKQKKEAFTISLQEEYLKTAFTTGKEDFFKPAKENAALTLEIAEETLTGSMKELEEVDKRLVELDFSLNMTKKEEQELSSLSSILSDSLSQKILQQYNETLFALKDEANRSQKEQLRLQEELHWQRALLASHAAQMQHFYILRKDVVKNKILEAKRVGLELVKKQLALKEKNLKEYLDTRTAHLAEERRILFEHLQSMQDEMKNLPKRWIAETIVEQKMEAGKKFQEKLTQLVESKNIAANLEVIRSRPVDSASYPTMPLFPKFILFSAASSFLFAFLASLALLARSSLQGPFLSEENLKASGFCVLGSFTAQAVLEDLSKMRDQDLNLIRKVTHKLLLQKDKRSLFFAKDKSFISCVAHLLAKMQKKAVIIHLFEGVEGKCQTDEEGTDEYFLGTLDRFNPEEALTKAFQEKLQKFSEGYDYVLLSSSSPADSLEASILCSLVSHCFIRIKQGRLKQMQAYYELILKGKELFFIVN